MTPIKISAISLLISFIIFVLTLFMSAHATHIGYWSKDPLQDMENISAFIWTISLVNVLRIYLFSDWS